MTQINLQLIGEYYYPTDACSRRVLLEERRLDRIPERRIDEELPRIVRRGLFIVINDNSRPTEGPGNPCVSCHLKAVCDSDECGRKLFRLDSRE